MSNNVMAVFVTARFSSPFVIVSFIICGANIVQAVCPMQVQVKNRQYETNKFSALNLNFQI